MKNKKWLLPAVSLILAVLALIAYTLLQEERTTLMYVQVMAAAFVPAIVPIISTITKKEFPPIVNILITVHVLLASHLGSALGFLFPIFLLGSRNAWIFWIRGCNSFIHAAYEMEWRIAQAVWLFCADFSWHHGLCSIVGNV